MATHVELQIDREGALVCLSARDKSTGKGFTLSVNVDSATVIEASLDRVCRMFDRDDDDRDDCSTCKFMVDGDLSVATR